MPSLPLNRSINNDDIPHSYKTCYIPFLLNLLFLSFGMAEAVIAESNGTKIGATETNDTGLPIGGGKGYPKTFIAPSYRVTSKRQFLSALKKAKGKVIYVTDSSKIDLTGERNILLPKGVTLASGRGENNSEGALIFSTEDRTTTKSERFDLFITGGPGVRLTGLRLRGPDSKQRYPRYAFLNSCGIRSEHVELTVDNCELWAWSHAAIYLNSGNEHHIHHNHIHHCRRKGLGYGVVINKAEALIEANIFSHNRHSIAGTGRSPSGYEARFNIVKEPGWNSQHAFDMHGGSDRKDGTHLAGDWLKIHHNTFHHGTAIVLRGVPRISCRIYENWLTYTDDPKKNFFKQKHKRGRVQIDKNYFGASKTRR